jgi:hypothetical protein
MLLGTGRKMRPVQRLHFGAVEPEQEVLREPLGVALHLFVQASGRDPVERGELGIEDDALAAQQQDRAGDVLDADERRALLRHRTGSVAPRARKPRERGDRHAAMAHLVGVHRLLRDAEGLRELHLGDGGRMPLQTWFDQ